MPLPKQVRLGGSGLKISPILVGCMSYGSKKWADWIIEDKEKVFELLKHCYDNGLRTFDTADVYSNGMSERLVGEFLRRYKINRETVVILTKVFFPVDESLDLFHGQSAGESTALALTNQRGLSRKHILDAAANSVERLGTYIDVLQIHRVDPETSMEETMRALNSVVEKGHTRYIGASSMLATEFAEMQFIAEKHGWFKFISSQSCYNLLYREDERELIPFAKRHNVGMIPWSPNARGVLTRPYGTQTHRSGTDSGLQRINVVELPENEQVILNRVEELANKKGVSMAAISTAWVLSKGFYPIVGLNSIERIDDALKAIDTQLTAEEVLYLEEHYKPKAYVA
ncbi:LANO_0E16776g1_1 [Lachancea nothofagi CBS 11611]|uniref:LANO_0E16776g1_1 n=1 Tax=Lachancea nothofagi CBS 11611 TaxID=1266666 RepID=A0A1G4K2K0_9SACH|nr:LANO_0E16776g1_1 [Lachancea nothofagi CBS 11611]